MKDIRVAFIGLGARGSSLLDVVLTQGEKVVALCDLYEDRIENAAKKVEEKQGTRPAGYKNYKDALADENVNTVIISCF